MQYDIKKRTEGADRVKCVLVFVSETEMTQFLDSRRVVLAEAFEAFGVEIYRLQFRSTFIVPCIFKGLLDELYAYVDIVLQIFFGRHRAAVELSAQFPDSDIYLIGKIAEATTEGVFYFHN